MTMSLAFLMAILVALLVAKFDLKWFHALICVLAGLTLGGTQVGDFLLDGLDATVTGISQIRF